MRVRNILIVSAAALFIASAVWVWRVWPRYTHISDGYVLADLPASGQRYIIDDGGIKKVGQQVLSYRIDGRLILGTVRRSLEDSEVQSFRLDMDTRRVDYLSKGDVSDEPAP
jgi:hypothetical protein